MPLFRGRSRFDYSKVDEEGRPPDSVSSHQLDSKAFNEACTSLRSSSIGLNQEIRGPFGLRPLLYADYTASGRALAEIERFVSDNVLPYYGNTHTLANSTGSQTTLYRVEARRLVKQYFNATHQDALIFCGSGSTAAVHKFLSIMNGSLWDVRGTGGGAEDGLPTSTPSGKAAQEDRWGSYECRLCGVRLKSEMLFRAHQFSAGHQQRLIKVESPTTKTLATAGGTAGSIPSGNALHRRLVVFLLDPTAHHSACLPFRELVLQGPVLQRGSAAVSFDIVTLPINPKTCTVDLAALEQELKLCQKLEQKINGFAQAVEPAKEESRIAHHFQVIPICVLSAGSNVTGLRERVPFVSELIHRYEGLACWDFAATGARMPVDFNPAGTASSSSPDVGFFSPHKLLGGPGTPGLLLLKKKLLRNGTPSAPGGGVVFFVDQESHSYVINSEEREEGGTPDILADIRAGLVYSLHSKFKHSDIAIRERDFTEYLIRNWGRNKKIQILGPLGGSGGEKTVDAYHRIGIISFAIKYGNDLEETAERKQISAKAAGSGGALQISAQGGLYLHHYFVTALLNDLFGVQVRGGCACAGPLGQFLLGLDSELTQDFSQCLQKTGQEVFRPGFVRASVHFSMSWDDVELLCQAVLWIANFGWKLLPLYTFVPETGEWHHRACKPQSHRLWLSSAFANFCSVTPDPHSSAESHPIKSALDILRFRSLTSDSTTPHKEPFRRKDPSKLAGAVALLPVAPGATGADPLAFKKDIRSALAGLKRAGTTVPLPSSQTEQKSEESPNPAAASDSAQAAPSSFASRLSAWQNLAGSSAKATSPSTTKAASATAGSFATALVRRATTDYTTPPQQPAGSSVADATVPPDPANKAEPSKVSGKESVSKQTTRSFSNRRSLLSSSASSESEQHQQMTTPSQNPLETSIDELIPSSCPHDLESLMAEAHNMITTVEEKKASLAKTAVSPPLPEEYLHLLWFALPVDAVESLAEQRPRPTKGSLPLLPSVRLQKTSSALGARPAASIFEVRNFSTAEDAVAGGSRPRKNSAGSEKVDASNTTEEDEDSLKTFLTKICGCNKVHLDNSRSADHVESVALFEFLKAEMKGSRNKNKENVVPLSRGVESKQFSTPEEKSSCDEVALLPLPKQSLLEIPRHLRHSVGMAVAKFQMIKSGDRLLLGLSGGKDSLSLLHILMDMKRRSPVKFELAAATVDPQTPEYNPHPLIPYMASLDVPYYMLSQPLIKLAKKHMVRNSICAFCSRMKRGMLYRCMRTHNYNVLVLGQHLDDICESFIMSAFHNGSLNTMKANYYVKDGDLRVCRPLIYTREKVLENFALSAKLPIIADNCPACFSQPKERHRIKLLLAEQEFEFPQIFRNLMKTVEPLIEVDRVEVLARDSDLSSSASADLSADGDCEDCGTSETSEVPTEDDLAHLRTTPAAAVKKRLRMFLPKGRKSKVEKGLQKE